jgi:hypothetical protein
MSVKKFRSKRAYAGLLVLGMTLAGCVPGLLSDDQQAARTVAPVLLIGTERLEPPAVPADNKVFQPTVRVAIRDDDSGAGQAAGFFVTLAVDAGRTVTFALVDVETGTRSQLEMVDPPADDAERALAEAPGPFNDAGRAALTAGRGVVWLAGGDPRAFERRFGLLIPEQLLSAFSRIEMYASTAEDGTPLGAARLELVRDFFYLAIVGDSIQWGNGLQEADKMSSLVGAVIERETRRKVIVQRYAQSGARIVPSAGDGVCEVGCNGEVPVVTTSITAQLDQIRRPELVDLVLMDGCINDVNVFTILNPATTEPELIALTDTFCDEAMTALLRKVRAQLPQAYVVVTGYFQFVSEQSDDITLETWELLRGFVGGEDIGAATSEIAAQAALFLQRAHDAIRNAIGVVNGEAAAAPPVVFADPGYGPDNAVFAPRSWLWGLSRDGEVLEQYEVGRLLEELGLALDVFPEDPLQRYRAEACLDGDMTESLIPCIYASVGHPNPDGARAYADAIIAELRDAGVLPPAAP